MTILGCTAVLLAWSPRLLPTGSALPDRSLLLSDSPRYVFETLYTVDQDWSPIPHLAVGHTVSNGGRRYTINLRKGVRFHNGKEMNAADVVASLNRWGRMNTVGKALWKSVEAVDLREHVARPGRGTS